MSAQRQFKATSERYGGQWLTVSRSCCRKCGVSAVVKIGKTNGLLPANVIEKKLVQKGWTIGANDQWDYCPGCTNTMKEKKPAMLKVVSAITAPSEEPPRNMTRDDRRIIISKLDAVYLDAKRGYDAGWSDQKVATDLGVPRKWVEDIRAENFGDVGTNEEMNEFYEQAKALSVEARKALVEARTYYEKVNALVEGQKADKVLAHIADRLGRVEKLGEAIRKYVVT
jgi:hypothetical protein